MVSIIMPVYNGARFLQEAIDSILNQSYTDFECIIINDGSTDNTADILKTIDDERFKIIDLKENLGNNQARNIGLAHAKGKYIAIADSDDISLPNRIEEQVLFLETHPDISLVYTSLDVFGAEDNRILVAKTDYEQIRISLFFKNVIWQPSVMYKKADFDNHQLQYRLEWEKMGDYDLWFRASQKGLKMIGLANPLVRYRVSDGQISQKSLSEREGKLSIFYLERLKSFGLELTSSEVETYKQFIRSNKVVDMQSFDFLKKLFRQLAKRNKKQHLYPTLFFDSILLMLIMRLLKSGMNGGLISKMQSAKIILELSFEFHSFAWITFAKFKL